MSKIPYNPRRYSLFRLANLDQLPPNKQKKLFLEYNQAIHRQRNHKTNPNDTGLCAELSRLGHFKPGSDIKNMHDLLCSLNV